ncbi:hypothetical protein [Cupriavidus malaysiensis]|uniref:Uncharacterized protein n=1 Tax=Cupriavidus malaysiensis TaxID=367825 RepID=A0ABN4TMS5_9BURK|nr:hypothetical protein [Cupriavidus malaysiensis]AOZ05916.1 hypothetical protein BKK80_08830 [Cupriavidus malaysiensis]
MGISKRSEPEGLSEVPTEGESPSVIDLERNLVAGLNVLPEGKRKETVALLLNAIRTRSTVVRIRAFVAMGKEHWMGHDDHVRIQRARWRYWSLPRDVVGSNDEPATVQDVSEPSDREAEKSWAHLLVRCYGLPLGVILLVGTLGYLALR